MNDEIDMTAHVPPVGGDMSATIKPCPKAAQSAEVPAVGGDMSAHIPAENLND